MGGPGLWSEGLCLDTEQRLQHTLGRRRTHEQTRLLTRSTAFLRLVSVSVSSTKLSQRPRQSAGSPAREVLPGPKVPRATAGPRQPVRAQGPTRRVSEPEFTWCTRDPKGPLTDTPASASVTKRPTTRPLHNPHAPTRFSERSEATIHALETVREDHSEELPLARRLPTWTILGSLLWAPILIMRPRDQEA